MTIFLGRTATVEKVLSAHVSDAVLEELAQDRKLELDHDDSTQFTMRVSKQTLTLSATAPSFALGLSCVLD